MCVVSHDTGLSLSELLHLAWWRLGPPTLLRVQTGLSAGVEELVQWRCAEVMGRLCPQLSKCCPWTEKNIAVLRHFSSLCLCFSRLWDKIKNLIILIRKHPSSGRKPWKHKEHLLNCCCVVSTVLHLFLSCSFSFVCFPLSLSFTPFHLIISDF